MKDKKLPLALAIMGSLKKKGPKDEEHDEEEYNDEEQKEDAGQALLDALDRKDALEVFNAIEDIVNLM